MVNLSKSKIVTPRHERKLNMEETLLRIKSKECIYSDSWMLATHVCLGVFSTRKPTLKIYRDFYTES